MIQKTGVGRRRAAASMRSKGSVLPAMSDERARATAESSTPPTTWDEALFSAECPVGRLVEARLTHLRTIEDVHAFQRTLRAAFESSEGRSVICADWRIAKIVAPDVAEALIGLLRTGNAFFERSAILLRNADATFSLQVERVVREANSPARRTFRDRDKMRAWLGAVLREDERHHMGTFLGGAPLLPREG